MLEALEKIKAAEEQKATKKAELIEELTAYEASQNQRLQATQQRLREEYAETFAAREQELAEKLEIEEKELTSRVNEQIDVMEETYQQKQKQTVKLIVERVISKYGSQ